MAASASWIAAGSTWVTTNTSTFSLLSTVQIVASLIAAALALLSPPLGAALLIVALTVACLISSYTLLGIAIFVLLALWWLSCARRTNSETQSNSHKTAATILALSPLAASLGLPLLIPLLAGFLLPWRRGLITSLTAFLLLSCLSVITAPVNPLGTSLLLHTSLILQNPTSLGTAASVAGYAPFELAFGRPEVWLALAGVLPGTLISTFFCKRATAAACVCGIVLATAIIGASMILPALWLSASPNMAAATAAALSLSMSCGLACLLAILGVVPLAEGSDA
jgi:hypothetical protein